MTLRAVAEAVASAEVTHAHPEGIAGAVAVAVAAALAADARLSGRRPAAGPLLDAVVAHVPDSQVRKGLRRAARMVTRSVEEAAWELGNGSNVLAQDTVPFALWVAARCLDDYPRAIVECVRAGGDVDTTGAIAGGVVAAFGGVGSRPGVLGVPPKWRDHREPLPAWASREPAAAQEP